MADKPKPTKEEIESQRAQARESALKTFKGKLTDLAAAFYVENSNQYGEAGASAVDEFIYSPAIRSEEGQKMVMDGLYGSRQGGRRYTGNVSEYQIISTAAKIVQESLGRLNIADIFGLMGSKVNIAEGLREGYLEDYAKSDSKEAKELAKTLTGQYIADLMDKKVAEALTKRAKARIGKLEEMVKEPEEAPKKK